jgi:ATP-dependent protease ClpP protease subunit
MIKITIIQEGLMIKIICAIALMLLTTPALSDSERLKKNNKFSMQPESTLVIDTVITETTMQPLYKKLESIVISKSKKPVTLVIDSPGGEVQAGLRFINLMVAAQQKGVRFDCVVHHLAASMAFQILSQCDNRLTHDNAMLLWHGVRLLARNISITSLVAEQLTMELKELDVLLQRSLIKSLSKDMSKKVIKYHNDMETRHTGLGLATKAPHFISSTSYVDGLYEVLINNKTTKTETPPISLFGLDNQISFIYVLRDYESDLIETLSSK